MLRRRSCPVPSASRPPWRHRVRIAAAAPIGRYLSSQAAKPHGTFGKLMAQNWLSESAAVNDAAVELLHPAPGERICEIGFGPGRTLSMLGAAGADVVGVEVSPDMVAMASRRNAGSVAAGRMCLHHGDGTTLPVADDSLDAVIGVHTIYFWPAPAATLTEVARALRSGGRLVLVFRDGDHPVPARFDPVIYHVPTAAEAGDWLQQAGFTCISVERRPHIATAVLWVTATMP